MTPSDTHSLPVGWSASGENKVLRLPLSTLYGHALVTGASGWGKSGFLLSQVLAHQGRRERTNLFVVDPKGDLVPEIRDRFAPALHASGAFASPEKINVVAPFGAYMTPLNPLSRIEGLEPEVQANLAVELLETLADGGLHARMRTIASWVLRAVIELQGSLLDVHKILCDETFRLSVAGRMSDPQVRTYLAEIFDSETTSSIAALRSRLEWLLLVPKVRASLCAKGCVRMDELLESPLTLVDLSGAPQGFVGLSKFFGAMFMSLLVAGALSRKVSESSSPVLCVVDEWQELIRGSAFEFERFLSLARFKKIGLWLANQTVEQVQSVSKSLLASVIQNVSIHVAFRPDPSDVKHLLALIPSTGRVVDPKFPDRLLSQADEKDRLIEVLQKLPKRHALLGDLVARRAHFIRTLAIPFAEAEARAKTLSPEVIERFRRGRVAVPYAEVIEKSRTNDTPRAQSGGVHQPRVDAGEKSPSGTALPKAMEPTAVNELEAQSVEATNETCDTVEPEPEPLPISEVEGPSIEVKATSKSKSPRKKSSPKASSRGRRKVVVLP
ncbi:MAG: hypothetical protein HYV07_07600 [Deltaproteobacteria bacterium]|nr:hypothetical protein [Deltaproteobacteria bacterium]